MENMSIFSGQIFQVIALVRRSPISLTREGNWGLQIPQSSLKVLGEKGTLNKKEKISKINNKKTKQE